MVNLDKSVEEEILAIVEKYQKDETRLLNYLIIDDMVTFFSPISMVVKLQQKTYKKSLIY